MSDPASTPAGASLPLVSVLIPAFNHERFIVRCLDSVLEDPYPSKEIIVIDDGSTDETATRIGEWVAAHKPVLPVTYRRRENRGIAATLNELVSLARGGLLRLGASDDYLLPGGLEAQVRYLSAHPHKAAVIGDAIVVDRDGRTLYESSMSHLYGVDKRLYLSDASIRQAVISHWAVSGAVTLARREALAAAGWSEDLHIEDWDFFLRLAARDALGFIDLRVCAYRLHGGNVSKTAHVATRIANLTESRQVAMRRADLFDEPCRTLLRSQAHRIAAKIAFLQRRPFGTAFHLAVHACMALLALLRQTPGARATRAV
ncbi:glycosyltransferase family 2 protein [Pseudoxanthomonas sp. UTMC 1351]|uniref:glycosyltransferase family 2 protein n=1 Tax=Pseudoxanthomonas sp. UTMC 1351 TaxID=2695853 RepID=UPI0034CE6862